VRISKLLILLVGCSLFAQSNISLEIDGKTVNDSIAPEEIEGFLSENITASNDYGKYFLLNSISSTGNTINYIVENSDVEVDTLIFRYPEIPLLKDNVEFQIFKNLINVKPGMDFEKQLLNVRKFYSFLPSEINFDYVKTPGEILGALIYLDPEFINYFSGIAGGSRSESNSWELTGEINIHLENLWQTAGLLNLEWKRPDSLSQWISFIINEPHPFGWAAGFGLEFEQELWHGEYVRTSSSLNTILSTGFLGRTSIGYRITKVNPTLTGIDNGIPYNVSKYLVFSSELDVRDDQWIPSEGYYWKFETALGSQKGDIDSEIGTIELESSFVRSFSKRFIGQLRLIGEGRWVSKGEINKGNLVHYGGSGSIRGYLEDQFTVPWYGIANVEIHMNAGAGSRIFLFKDIAGQEPIGLWRQSYGIGYIQKTDKFIIRLAYGLGKDDIIKNGKIHVQFLTYF